MIVTQNGENVYVISTQNNDFVKTFKLKSNKSKSIAVKNNVIEAIATLKNGAKRKLVINQGSGYMSSNSKRVIVDDNIKSLSFRLLGKETWENLDISF